MEGNSGSAPPTIPSTPGDDSNIKPFTSFQSKVDPLAVRVIPSCQHALKGVINPLEVLFQIKTENLPEEEGQEKQKRKPIDLAIVLDRSGSMSGEKINNSKDAIIQVIENLTPEDSLHFITYDNNAEIVFENGDLSNKDALVTLVKAVGPRGSTNMEAGMTKARDVLVRHQKEDGRTQRMYLFSDGLVNCGALRSRDELFKLMMEIYREKKISCCTFGIGDDFDEDLMKGLAEYGSSYYFYIDSHDRIEAYVSAALGALLGVVGNDAVLKVRGKNGGVVKKIHGHDIIKGAVIGDIKQNNLKNILVELDFSPNSQLEEEEALTWELTYTRTKGDKEVVKATGVLQIKNTEDDTAINVKNDEVMIASVIQRSAGFDEEVLDFLNNGKRPEAVLAKKKEIELLKEYEKKDVSGRISSLLLKAELALKELESSTGEKKKMEKLAKYHANLKRNDSADWMALC